MIHKGVFFPETSGVLTFPNRWGWKNLWYIIAYLRPTFKVLLGKRLKRSQWERNEFFIWDMFFFSKNVGFGKITS